MVGVSTCSWVGALVVASVRTWLIVCFRYCAVDGDHLSHHLLFFSFFFCVRPCSGIVRRIYCCTAVVLLLCCCCAIIVRKMWVHGVGVGCFFSDVCCAVLPLYWYQVRRTAAVDTTYCWTSTRWLGGSVQGCVHVLVGHFLFIYFLPLYRPRAGIAQRTTSGTYTITYYLSLIHI